MSDSVTILVATRNPGKLAQMSSLADAITGLVLRSLDGYEIDDVEETGETYAANATLKALAVSRATGRPSLADDSGLEVDALHGAPGVYSARYSGEGASDEANIHKLLEQMANIPQRNARFRSVLALADVAGPLQDQVILAEGCWEGMISTQPRGQGGFGYDPIFYLPPHQATAAELPIATKNQISHRSKALVALLPKLSDYFSLKISM